MIDLLRPWAAIEVDGKTSDRTPKKSVRGVLAGSVDVD
jgi:hypothetical protein